MQNWIKDLIDRLVAYAKQMGVEIAPNKLEIQCSYSDGYDIVLYFEKGDQRPLRYTDYSACYCSYDYIPLTDELEWMFEQYQEMNQD